MAYNLVRLDFLCVRSNQQAMFGCSPIAKMPCITQLEAGNYEDMQPILEWETGQS